MMIDNRPCLKLCTGLILLIIGLLTFCAHDAYCADASGHSVRSPINTGGPEDWPEDAGLSTSLNGAPPSRPAPANPLPERTFPASPLPGRTVPASALPDLPAPSGAGEMRQPASPAPLAPVLPELPAPAQPDLPVPDLPAPPLIGEPSPTVPPLPQPSAPAPQTPALQGGPSGVVGIPAQGTTGAAPEPQPQPEPEPESPGVVYVDEEGNPVPEPEDPEAMLKEAQDLLNEGKYDDAMPIFEHVRQLPGIANDLLERALYGISDSQWARYQDNPLAGYEPIVSSTNEALNANIRSSRVPDAMLRLGLANINVGNLADASGYIVALMRRFPEYPGVAQGFTALGQAQLKEGRNAEAEQSFNIILDKYPESSELQDASVGLARALAAQGKDERAQVILDFINKRWPRYYISDPDFLLLQAENDGKMHNQETAQAWRWLYVNIEPWRPANAPVLLGMGDEYFRSGQPEAAEFVYRQIVENFPDTPQAVTAQLRLAEKGIYDSPVTYGQMSRIFSRDARPTLWQVYNDLIARYPDAPESVLARLKQAMWLYWDNQYPEAMGKAADFIDEYPQNAQIPEARELLWNAFQKELAISLAEHNYGRILLLWNGFPFIRERYGKIDGPLRFALAEGWMERGDTDKAFELLSEFLTDTMDPTYGEAAFSQFFNYYLQQGAWDKILDLGNLVRNWQMKPELQNQLDYAMALSAQNLNMGNAALSRWRQLAPRTDIPLYQQAYATYFLAKDAENRRDIKEAYENNRKVVEMFTQLSEERSDKADPDRIREAVASLMDICEVGNRIPEALEWVERYKNLISEDSPEYAGLKFREARLYRKLGDLERARLLLEDITQRYPDSPYAPAAAGELHTFDVSRDLQRYLPATSGSAP